MNSGPRAHELARLTAAQRRELRARLVGAGYTATGVLDLLGPAAHAALGRAETVPALLATTGSDPLSTLIRLFILQAGAAGPAATRALGPELVDALTAAGVLGADEPAPLHPASGADPHHRGMLVRARLDIRPYAADDLDWYIAADLGTGIRGASGPVGADQVLGVGGASTVLAQVTVRPPVSRALDIGTGCGVQALHLAQHARHVVGTDLNPRALAFAALSAALSGVAVDLRPGDLFAPVTGERFDLVVSNPPFVISPSAAFAYRDSGHPADDLCAALIGQAPQHLVDGGYCQLLASWLHVRGEDWRERVAGWVLPTGCDALVLQREVLDPMAYVELWLADSGETDSPDYASRYEHWLDWLQAQQVQGIGFGWVCLHATGSTQPQVRLQDLRHAVSQPVGPALLDWFTTIDQLRRTDDDTLLGWVVVPAEDVRIEHETRPVRGPGGVTQWATDGGHARIRQLAGLRRSGGLDPVGISVLTGCDGRTPLGTVLARVADAGDLPLAGLVDGALSAVRTLLEEGFLRRAGSGGAARVGAGTVTDR